MRAEEGEPGNEANFGLVPRHPLLCARNVCSKVICICCAHGGGGAWEQGYPILGSNLPHLVALT